METPATQNQSAEASSVEILGMAGFGLSLGWMLIVSFWIFFEPNAGALSIVRPAVQLWLFAGIAAGFIVIYFLCRLPRFTPFCRPLVVGESISSIILPVLSLIQLQEGPFLVEALCAAGFITGMASANMTISWLDVCSRLRTRKYGRFTGTAFLVGSLSFILGAVLPNPAGPVLAILYALTSIGLLAYTSETAIGNDERAPLASLRKGWSFQLEIEPSFFVFGITFGMTFAWLFTAGNLAVFIGLCSIIPGALCITLLSVFHVKVNITMVLRIVLCLCVFACVFMPQSTEAGRLGCSCLIVAGWAMFTALNYAFIVRKSVIVRDVPCFREIPLRLAVPASGFAVGWLVIFLGTLAFGTGAPEFENIRLFFAVLLVVVFALFFPSQDHHSMDSSATSPTGLDELETFNLRLQGVAKTYGLSPREVEVARYLARGRNAAYIQERLVVSPHTVRSHMYNIYKKMHVHSQQEVIEIVDVFAIDSKDYS